MQDFGGFGLRDYRTVMACYRSYTGVFLSSLLLAIRLHALDFGIW